MSLSAVTVTAFPVAMTTIAVVLMFMMTACHLRIIRKVSFQKSFHRRIRAAGYAAVKADACLCQGIFGSLPDTAADQRIHLLAGKHAGQSAMAAAIGIHYLRRKDLFFFRHIDFKLLRMAKMLIYFPVFISYCYSH